MGHFICFGVILSLFSSSAMFDKAPECSKPTIALSKPITEQLRKNSFWTIYFSEPPSVYPLYNNNNTCQFKFEIEGVNEIDLLVRYEYWERKSLFKGERVNYSYSVAAYKTKGIFELTGAPNFTPGFVFGLSAADIKHKLYIYRDCAPTSTLFWVQSDHQDFNTLSNFSDTAVSNLFHMAGLSQELQEMKRKHLI